MNKSTTKLSAGTRVEILSECNCENEPYHLPDCVFVHGQVVVRLRSKPSNKLREQGFSADGIFDIEADYVTIIRPREDVYEKELREKRRRGKPRKVAEASNVG